MQNEYYSTTSNNLKFKEGMANLWPPMLSFTAFVVESQAG